MKPEETIELLKGIQNEKVDYAELVCAPAFAYGYQYVYPEPEDYAIEEAIEALKEVQRYREIGTVEECREAVEKQKPKKPNRNYEKFSGLWCKCGWYLGQKRDLGIKYCPNCGQAIDENLEGREDGA